MGFFKNEDFRTDKEKKIDLLVDEYVFDEGLSEWNASFEDHGLWMAEKVTDERVRLENLPDEELNKEFKEFKNRNKDSQYPVEVKGL